MRGGEGAALEPEMKPGAPGPRHQQAPGAAREGQARFEHATADPAQPARADGALQGA